MADAEIDVRVSTPLSPKNKLQAQGKSVSLLASGDWSAQVHPAAAPPAEPEAPVKRARGRKVWCCGRRKGGEDRRPRPRKPRKMINGLGRAIGSSLQPLVGLSNSLLGPTKPHLRPCVLPTGFQAQAPTPQAELEGTVQALASRAQEWADLGTAERAKLLRATLKRTVKVARAAAEAATAAKGSYGTGCGEEYMAWLPVAWGLRGFAEALEAGGQPATNGTRQRPDGQLIVDAFPIGEASKGGPGPRRTESLFFGGFQGEVWLEPGQTEVLQGGNYRRKREGKKVAGSVALVLGAGNQTAVACLDILHKLLFDDAVVVCKMNPCNEYLGEFIRQAYEPLVTAGYVAVVYGGLQEGSFLTQHPAIASIHLTGSAATYDAVVWGKQPKRGEPPLKKQVGAELGCVTPYIVCPGEWSAADLQYHAEEMVACLVHNAGHNCTKVEVLVTDAAWPQRAAFVEAVRAELARTAQRVAWYPGSRERAAGFEKAFPHVEKLGERLDAQQAPGGAGAGALPPNYMPWHFAPGLTPETARTGEEHWCGVLQEVGLPGCGGDPATFLSAAVDFANTSCWGTLSCSLFVPPSILGPQRALVDDAVARLRYGCVAVNTLSMLGFCFVPLTWGAFPGNTPQDIGSGNCAVHNTLLLDHPQKSVLWGPWRYYPTHPWSPRNRNLEAMVPSAIDFLVSPNLLTLMPPLVAGLRG